MNTMSICSPYTINLIDKNLDYVFLKQFVELMNKSRQQAKSCLRNCLRFV